MDFYWLFPFLEAPEARHYDWNLHERFYVDFYIARYIKSRINFVISLSSNASLGYECGSADNVLPRYNPWNR